MKTTRYLGALTALLTSGSAWATTVGPQQELASGPTTANQRAPAVVWDATAQAYVVVFQEDRGDAEGVNISAVRISAAGALLDPTPCPVVAAANRGGDEVQPSVAYNATDGSLVVAWTEARSGLNDIFAARLRPVPCLSDREVQVTSGQDSESQPSVAAGSNAIWVAFQINRLSGASGALVRRYGTTLTAIDATATDMSGANALRPAVAAQGSAAALVFERSGDLFGLSLPATGPLPAQSAAITVSNAALGQSYGAVSPLGPGWAVIWQDARAGTGLEDVYGRRYPTTLVAGPTEVAVSLAASGQLTPAVAGDASEGLAVWQDRRAGGPIAQIYGTQLNPASGAAVVPDGFPIITTTGNAYEPAVAKGPGNDYLVVAVRFGSPNRIHYRVVRSELPAGSLSAPPAQAPADGVTQAVLTFSPAVGVSGLQVVDGTLYTVTAPASATIDAPDADPTRAGHQLGAYDGQVRVPVVSNTVGQVTITLASVGGTAVGTGLATFTSAPPTASLVAISPSAPTTAQDLVLTYLYSDPDGDPESGTLISWTRDNLVQPAFEGLLRVPASATHGGEAWRARVTPSDGTNLGSPAFSNTVVIQSAPPTATNVDLAPTAPRTGTTLRLSYTYQDPDGDPEGATEISWTESGVAQPALQGARTVAGVRVVKGQRWRATVRPHDGVSFGAAVSSPEVLVLNTPPTAYAGEDQMVTGVVPVSLDGSGSSDPDPQDTLRFTWRQLAGPTVTLQGVNGPNPSFITPAVSAPTALRFELVVSDGEASSNPDWAVVDVIPPPDSDGDGLSDDEEATLHTDPSRADTDRDGLGDGEELDLGTDPLDADSDDDGVPDGRDGTADPDGDGRPAALDPDSDGDGVLDGVESRVTTPVPAGGGAYPYQGTDVAAGAYRADADPGQGTDPLDPDTDGDGLADGVEDANRNGALDPGETDPNDPNDPPPPCNATVPCPSGLVCQDGACVAPDAGTGADAGPADSGLACGALPVGTECCSGACLGGSPVDPICPAGDGPPMCPAGAELCNTGACTRPGGLSETPAPQGCGCQGTTQGAGSPFGLLGLLLLFGLRRRGRGAVSRAQSRPPG
ncbi:MAG: hypothetical protein KC933_26605 [Myxococcales bacterium]|nr:hypothetical protein [Myxococcales bacterium]